MKVLFGLKLDNKDLFVFIIGLFSMIKFRVLGTFGISELLVFASYCYINPMFATREKQVRRLIAFAFIWLVGVLLSDFVNNSSSVDSLKGAFNVIFLIMLIPFGYWALYDKPVRMLWFWAGVAISSILGFKYQRMETMDAIGVDTWQVYAAKWLFLFLGGWLYYKGRIKLAYIIIIVFATWTLFHQSRNIFLLFLLPTSILIYLGKINNFNRLDKYRRFRKETLKLLLLLGVVFIGITYTYETLAAQGELGEYAQRKYKKQKSSELGLASGRADFFASLYAISKKPIFGYGSYAIDKNQVYDDFNRMVGLPLPSEQKDSIRVPAHSYMLGAWVNAGILGFLFWIFTLKKIFYFLRYYLFDEPKLIYMILLLTFSFLWDIFFSPFSDRLLFIFYILAIIIISNKNKQLSTQ